MIRYSQYPQIARDLNLECELFLANYEVHVLTARMLKLPERISHEVYQDERKKNTGFVAVVVTFSYFDS